MSALGSNLNAPAAAGAAPQAPLDSHDEMDDIINAAMRMGAEKDRIVTRAPEEPFRLTFSDVTCLLVNRTIGTGIFNGPQEVMKGARTPGIAILMWFCGCIYCLAGSHVFLEYGLNVPRYVIDGVEQSVPRSGGELHYLQYIFSRPRYKKDTVVLIGVMFGLSFICVGNMASNCIDCASRLLILGRWNDMSEAQDPPEALIRGIAIVIATATCFIHAFSRRGGILLNNVLAVVKLLFLVSIVLSTWVMAGGKMGLGRITATQMGIQPAVETDDGQNSSAEAFLFVVFAFFGFDQPSYVLGEIKNPRKNFPKAMWWGMGMVSVLYLAVNICFMLVVPADIQMSNNVAEEFFTRMFDSNNHAKLTVNAFLAISSFGNVVVWTFTAARMKQEIAKQCYLPFSGFFAKDKDISLGRFLMWLESAKWNTKKRQLTFLNPANHREKTPVGAFTLHLASCIVLICATFGAKSNDAYIVLSSLFSYLLAAWFGAFLALGILILHIRGPPATQPVQTPNHNSAPDQAAVNRTWREITKGSVSPKMSIVCAVLYLVGSLYPVIASWVPPPKSHNKPSGAWYIVPVSAMCILAFASIWFCGFLGIAKYRKYHGKEVFVRLSKPEFEWAEQNEPTADDDRLANEEGASVRRRGGLILSHETIHPAWLPSEIIMPLQSANSRSMSNAGGGVFPPQRDWDDTWHTDYATELHNAGFIDAHPPGPTHSRYREPRFGRTRSNFGNATS